MSVWRLPRKPAARAREASMIWAVLQSSRVVARTRSPEDSASSRARAAVTGTPALAVRHSR